MTQTPKPAKVLYKDYTALGGKKAFSSFKNRAEIEAAIAAISPPPVKTKKAAAPVADATLSGKVKKLGRSMTKIERALARRFYDRHELTRPDAWIDAELPVELIAQING